MKGFLKPNKKVFDKEIVLEPPKTHVCQNCKYYKEIEIWSYECSNRNLHEMDKLWVNQNNVKLCKCDL